MLARFATISNAPCRVFSRSSQCHFERFLAILP